MTDPIASGGAGAVRFAVSTIPAVIATSIGLALPIGLWMGNGGAGVSTGFSAAIVVPMITEYMRRGSLAAKGADTRRTLFALVNFLYTILPVLAATALVVGIVAISSGFGTPMATTDHVIAIIGIVFAIIAVIASVALIALLRSPLWKTYRAAATGV